MKHFIPILAAVSCLQLFAGPDPVPQSADARLAQIIVVSNQVEIAIAEQAKEKVSDAKVAAFVDELITSHIAMLNDAEALFDSIRLVPVESNMSRDIAAKGAAKLQDLSRLEGAEYITAFLTGQVEGNKKCLEEINRWIPTIQNAELKAFLEQGEAVVRRHLEEAQALLGQVN
ncbi:MAG: DUF4142 domain-containing protein [Deltaproteobacteria bacterium]|nr:DUF4142 domain-containing protein [Deltaproteobacteria bacterium]MBI3295819.1 DUF4142 domain-containing protein [Deltaproteobacteria bacterium]